MSLRADRIGVIRLFAGMSSPSMLLHSRSGAITLGFLLAVVLTWPRFVQVWSTGVFLNPDDAMRAVEVRDFMAGQGWFDLVPRRLSPNHPFPMHWSRLVDLPLAGLVGLFRLMLAPTAAELAMRLVEPALLLVVSLWLVAAMARTLVGPRATLPATLLFAGSPEILGTFLPGHIHHHNVQVTLLLGAAKCLVDALGARDRAGPAAAAGGLSALSLGVGLQNLPFVVGLSTVIGLAWVWSGASRARSLCGFGLGLAGMAVAAFLADVPPSAYGQGACDAFSTAHLLAAGSLGLGFAALAAGTPRLGARPLRLAAVGSLAVVVLLLVAMTYPSCLRDPMAGVDPLLRRAWLADVGEALPLATFMARAPADGLALLVTLLAGWVATARAAACTSSDLRASWLALLLLVTVGVVGSFWQIRVASSAGALAIPGVVRLVVSVFERLATDPRRPALLVAILAGIVGNGAGPSAFASVVGGLVTTPATPSTATQPATNPALCFEPGAYATLAALPPGLVLSTIDPGSAILAATHHGVLAAPYHRNTYGNRVALLALDLPPAEARHLVVEARADYLAICRASNETAESDRKHPESISADILAGRSPGWLQPLSAPTDLVQVFRVTPELRPTNGP